MYKEAHGAASSSSSSTSVRVPLIPQSTQSREGTTSHFGAGATISLRVRLSVRCQKASLSGVSSFRSHRHRVLKLEAVPSSFQDIGSCHLLGPSVWHSSGSGCVCQVAPKECSSSCSPVSRNTRNNRMEFYAYLPVWGRGGTGASCWAPVSVRGLKFQNENLNLSACRGCFLRIGGSESFP